MVVYYYSVYNLFNASTLFIHSLFVLVDSRINLTVTADFDGGEQII